MIHRLIKLFKPGRLSEGKVLKEKLGGYEDYLRRVKYLLIPGVW